MFCHRISRTGSGTWKKIPGCDNGLESDKKQLTINKEAKTGILAILITHLQAKRIQSRQGGKLRFETLPDY